MSNISEINGQLINAATASLSLSVSGSLTGSLLGTSSWATNSLTASYVNGNIFTSTNPALSASYALTASFALNGGGGGITLIQAGTGIDVTNGSGPTVTISATSTGGTNLGLVYAVSLGYLMP